MRSIMDNLAKLAQPQSPQTALVYRYDDRVHASYRYTWQVMQDSFKKRGKEISRQAAQELVAKHGLPWETFSRSTGRLQIGQEIGCKFGAIKIREGDENPEVVQRHVEFFTIAERIVPFAEVYLAPNIEAINGNGPTKDPFLNIYTPMARMDGKGNAPMFKRARALLIRTENTFEQAKMAFLIGVWGLIEDAIKDCWYPDFLPALSADIAQAENALAGNDGFDQAERRFAAWHSYATRRIGQTNIGFDAELMHGPDQVFEQVWNGQFGDRLAKLITTSANLHQMARQFPAAFRKAA